MRKLKHLVVVYVLKYIRYTYKHSPIITQYIFRIVAVTLYYMLTDSGYTKGKISKETDFMHILLFISFAFHVVVNIGGIFAAPFRMRRLLRCMSTIASVSLLILLPMMCKDFCSSSFV